MLEAVESCRDFRDALHRYLDDDSGLVGQASFVGHLATCSACRLVFLQYNNHIQAHRILAAGGMLDGESVSSLSRSVPVEFASISEGLVRKRARELGRLKYQIQLVYLKHLMAENVYPQVLGPEGLNAAQKQSHNLIDKLERYKESNVIFADGGLVDLSELRNILEHPLDTEHEGLEPQLQSIARGLLTARTLDPTLDEYVLQHMGVILEKLGYYEEARRMFLTVANLTPGERPHLRAKALNSAAHTSFRYLDEFDAALEYLEEANRLFPHRWTIEYNLASFYLWPSNPKKDREAADLWFQACKVHAPTRDALQNLLEHDGTMRSLLEAADLLEPPLPRA